MNIYFVCFE